MTAARIVRPVFEGADADQAGAATPDGDDVGVFLAAVATLMHETIMRFEETVGRVTETIVAQSGRADRDLVVVLQDFDRLQQEFVALGNVVAHFAATTSGSRLGGRWTKHHGYAAIDAISIAELKDSFVRYLEGDQMEFDESQMSEEVVF